jgi:DNA modification methylase
MSDEPKPRKPKANTLDGSTWTRYSVSVWSDIQKDAEERALKHPALFPVMLVQRLLDCFTRPGDSLVIDPFCGAGSTLLGACAAGKNAVGLDLSPHYVEMARERLAARAAPPGVEAAVYQEDAANLLQYVAPGSADFCLTSPPYWDILTRRRSADYKETRHYGDEAGDLGRVEDYGAFLDALAAVMEQVFEALRPGAYACVVVMDLRKRARFFPFHADLAARMQTIGFIYDDLIIWDRRREYNNLRPLGYPYKFRINKVHEFILIFQKPEAG